MGSNLSDRRAVGRTWRTLGMVVALSVIAGAFVAFDQPQGAAAAGSACGPDINAIACENAKAGNDPDEWQIRGAGDASIQGFATDISVNAGSAIDFKIDTDASAYTIDVYRTGWYDGLGARFIDSVPVSAKLPQKQPECISDVATELYDCGTWGVSASWRVPADAVSGVYIAKLTRTDTGGASHIIFIVRNDDGKADIVFQTSDPTWHAYNTYGGSDFYQGAANGRAYKISYNRPFATRGSDKGRDFYFSSEYATVRFLERNGYDIDYIAGVDTDRAGARLLNHKVFLSVGHDEYWSGAQRANMEAARDAGVNLQFLTGNEGYWRARYEPSVDSSATPYRTLVSYKETWSNAKIDPAEEWTGTWRDPRFADAEDGGTLPENALTGTIYMSNNTDLPITVSSDEGKLRLWRNTSLTSLPAGESQPLAEHTVGYESDEDIDNGYRPAGLFAVSTTIGPTPQYVMDYGNTVTPGTTKHQMTMYRAESGALVWGTGTIQWGWGLDQTHDGDGAPADPRMQQAQINVLADMGAQPSTLMSGMAAASKSTDTTPPVTTITSPTNGQKIAHGTKVAVTGTASDKGGRVAGVEVSADGGTTWHPAVGTTNWTYSYIQQGMGETNFIARAVDDSGNYVAAGTTSTINVTGPYSVWGSTEPTQPSASDKQGVELGITFTPTVDGFVDGIRFYKGESNTGTHTGTLWSTAGRKLATVQFSNETETGWQFAKLPSPIEVTADTEYVVSYTAPEGGYAYDGNYFPYRADPSTPLEIDWTGVGSASPSVYGAPGEFPARSYGDANYYVDVRFTSAESAPLTVVDRNPKASSTSNALDTTVSAQFSRAVEASSVGLSVAASDSQALPGAVSYDAAAKTVTFTPDEPLEFNTRYTATPRAKDANGAELDGDASWTFTTQKADQVDGDCPCTLFSESVRPTVNADDNALVTLGVSFSPSQDGEITAIKYYKNSRNTGKHTGKLWAADGTELASVAFDDSSSTGWQTATFSEPIPVTAGATYIASYVAPTGSYSATPGVFSDRYTRGPLTVPAGGARYTYSSGFPTSTSSTSYLVDVVFDQATADGP